MEKWNERGEEKQKWEMGGERRRGRLLKAGLSWSGQTSDVRRLAFVFFLWSLVNERVEFVAKHNNDRDSDPRGPRQL